MSAAKKAVKKVVRKTLARHRLKTPHLLDADEVRDEVLSRIGEIFSPAYIGDGTDEEIRDVFDNVDENESEADVRRDFDKAVREVNEVMKTIEKQLKSAEALRHMLKDPRTQEAVLQEWREGMVECPNCQHVFKGENHTL